MGEASTHCNFDTYIIHPIFETKKKKPQSFRPAVILPPIPFFSKLYPVTRNFLSHFPTSFKISKKEELLLSAEPAPQHITQKRDNMLSFFHGRLLGLMERAVRYCMCVANTRINPFCRFSVLYKIYEMEFTNEFWTLKFFGYGKITVWIILGRWGGSVLYSC